MSSNSRAVSLVTARIGASVASPMGFSPGLSIRGSVTVTVPIARGTVAHKAVELGIHWPHEPLPLTLVEAQCAGLPCVVSDLVTRESALTSLVSFCGIDRAELFAEALASVGAVNREQASDEAIAEVRAAGYDVTDNAETLVKWYETLIREAKA